MKLKSFFGESPTKQPLEISSSIFKRFKFENSFLTKKNQDDNLKHDLRKPGVLSVWVLNHRFFARSQFCFSSCLTTSSIVSVAKQKKTESVSEFKKFVLLKISYGLTHIKNAETIRLEIFHNISYKLQYPKFCQGKNLKWNLHQATKTWF